MSQEMNLCSTATPKENANVDELAAARLGWQQLQQPDPAQVDAARRYIQQLRAGVPHGL